MDLFFANSISLGGATGSSKVEYKSVTDLWVTIKIVRFAVRSMSLLQNYKHRAECGLLNPAFHVSLL
jgi:hypothetical protein